MAASAGRQALSAICGKSNLLAALACCLSPCPALAAADITYATPRQLMLPGCSKSNGIKAATLDAHAGRPLAHLSIWEALLQQGDSGWAGGHNLRGQWRLARC